MATFPTDVAAGPERPTLSCAVDQVPVAMLYKSTAFKCPLPAVTPVRRQPLAPQTQQTTSCTPQTRKRYTIAHTRQPKQQPLNKQRQTEITCKTSREDGHVPNRCRPKTTARRTELRSRPGTRCTVVQVHGTRRLITCCDTRETATSCTANTTNNKPHASNTQTLQHRPHSSTQTAAPRQTA
jgi:hypothetical protein